VAECVNCKEKQFSAVVNYRWGNLVIYLCL